jgi:hypothetical protein
MHSSEFIAALSWLLMPCCARDEFHLTAIVQNRRRRGRSTATSHRGSSRPPHQPRDQIAWHAWPDRRHSGLIFTYPWNVGPVVTAAPTSLPLALMVLLYAHIPVRLGAPHNRRARLSGALAVLPSSCPARNGPTCIFPVIHRRPSPCSECFSPRTILSALRCADPFGSMVGGTSG